VSVLRPNSRGGSRWSCRSESSPPGSCSRSGCWRPRSGARSTGQQPQAPGERHERAAQSCSPNRRAHIRHSPGLAGHRGRTAGWRGYLINPSMPALVGSQTFQLWALSRGRWSRSECSVRIRRCPDPGRAHHDVLMINEEPLGGTPARRHRFWSRGTTRRFVTRQTVPRQVVRDFGEREAACHGYRNFTQLPADQCQDSPIPRTGGRCGAAYRPMLDRVIKKLSEVATSASFAS